ncbi:hypothetical protein GGI05_002978, partial [Coemansia sp. RSA 2603]
MYRNPLSLISNSNIRYAGILKDINEVEQIITLENVRSMGTEGRQGDPAKEIPPSNDVYEFIHFRASDVKDIVFEPGTMPQQPAVPNDPAILEARAKTTSGQSHPQQQYQQPVAQAAPAAYTERSAQQNYQAQVAHTSNVQQDAAEEAITDTESVTDTNERQQSGYQRRQGGYNNGNNSRGGYNNRGGRGGYNYNHNNNNRGGYNNRGGRGGYNARGNRRVEIPESDFDFESSNSKLNKVDLAKEFAKLNVHVADGAQDSTAAGSNTTAATASEAGQSESVTPSYMPKKSFFDDISCEAKERMQMQQQGLSYEERRGRIQAER